jgi:hypothetical protein
LKATAAPKPTGHGRWLKAQCYLAYFETTLDCRFCRYVRCSGRPCARWNLFVTLCRSKSLLHAMMLPRFSRIRVRPRVLFALPRPLALHPAPRRAGGGGLKVSQNAMKMLAGRFGSSEGASRSGGCLAPNLCLCWIGRKHVLEFYHLTVFLSLCTGLQGIWLASKRSWIADFVAARRTFYVVMYSLTAFFVAVYGTPGHFAYFETTLICIFCRYTQDSGAFCLLRNDLGLQILSLYTRDSGAFCLL